MSIMGIVCMVTGAVCIIYFLAIFVMAGAGSKFFIFGILAGMLLIAFGLELRHHLILGKLPGWTVTLLKIGFAAAAVVFLFVEGCIVSSFWAKGEPGLDYLVVLGAQVREGGPSRSLRMRLDSALAYLAENEGTKVIVSGGQGADEPMSEADCMAQYLEDKGIAPQRIIKENQSTNTAQNLQFSRVLAEGDAAVGVVTNRFHVFRSVRIARKSGFTDACGIAADVYLPTLPSDMLREFFGVLKDILVGNM